MLDGNESMDIKILLTCAAMAATAAFAAGDTYYVDDDGSDNNSGTSPELTGETLPDGTPVGPKFTLKAGLGLAKSGDTVCVLPGHYRDSVVTNGAFLARAVVPDGVKLVSRNGRDVTFIHGAAAVAVPTAAVVATGAVVAEEPGAAGAVADAPRPGLRAW